MQAQRSYSQRRPAAAFVRDWLIFAAMPLWLLWVVSRLYGLDLFTGELQKGTLVVYGLSCFVAHYDDLGLGSWEPKNLQGQLVRWSGETLRWLTIVLSLLIIAGVAAGLVIENLARREAYAGAIGAQLAQDFITPMNAVAGPLGWAVASVGLVVGISSTYLLTRNSHSG